MAKAYWVTWYRAVSDLAAHAQYAEMAGPAIQALGGRFLVRGMSSATLEGSSNERSVVIEFESVAQAIAAYHHPSYQVALALLKGAVEREVRIFEASTKLPAHELPFASPRQ